MTPPGWQMPGQLGNHAVNARSAAWHSKSPDRWGKVEVHTCWVADVGKRRGASTIFDSRMHHAQAEQLLERIEVAVTVQQRMTATETERRDQAVDGLANGPPPGTQSAVVPRRSHRELNATRLEDLETSQISEHASGFLMGGETLQNLADHQVEQCKRLTRELPVQPIGFECRDVV